VTSCFMESGTIRLPHGFFNKYKSYSGRIHCCHSPKWGDCDVTQVRGCSICFVFEDSALSESYLGIINAAQDNLRVS
jgi:hypothetical protein